MKEKFGTLRFYIRTPNDVDDEPLKPDPWFPDVSPAPAGFMAFRPVAGVKRIRELISEAEGRSASVCEKCGAPGALREGGGWHTYCDVCEQEKLAADEKARKVFKDDEG